MSSHKTERRRQSKKPANSWTEQYGYSEHGGHRKQGKSLGALFKAQKTKPRSPELTGQIRIQRHTIKAFVEELKRTDDHEVIGNIAGWRNVDKRGVAYLTVELSQRFQSQQRQKRPSDILDEFCE